jgi:hypothetical protein
MADLGTMTGEPEKTGVQEAAGRPGRRIRRARGLPGGRAVVGALLITAAAVGVFAAFLTATAEPSTHYAVARGDIEVGTRIDSDAAVAELFEFVPVDLPHDVSVRAVQDVQAPQLVGQLVTAPISRGDLLLASAIVDDDRVPATEKLSFSLPAADAVGGALQAGERIDVLATYGSGADAWTAFVVRGVLLVAVDGGDAGMGGSSDVTLTVAVSSLEDVQALGHAVRAADVFVTRSTVTEGSTDPAPGAFAPSRDQAPPRPDPAGDPLGPGAPQPTPDGDDAEAEGAGDAEAEDAGDATDDPPDDDAGDEDEDD